MIYVAGVCVSLIWAFCTRVFPGPASKTMAPKQRLEMVTAIAGGGQRKLLEAGEYSSVELVRQPIHRT